MTNEIAAVEAWSEKIATAWRDTVQGIIKTGQLLVEAWRDLKGAHGAWSRLIGDGGHKSKLPFSPYTAKALVAIAKDEKIRRHAYELPPHWDTLYKLTQLSDDEFQAAITDGRIHPGMERSEVKKLQQSEQPSPLKKDGTPKQKPRPKPGKEKAESKPQTGREPQIEPAVKQAIAEAFLDEGKSRVAVATEYDVGENTVKLAVAEEKGRRDPYIDPETLPKTTQEKLEIAIRQATRKLEADFERRVREAVRQELDDMVLPYYNKKLEEYDEVIKSRKGVLTNEEYRLIISCLHPDRVSDPETKERFERAFSAFKSHEVALRSEKDMPTTSVTLPRNWEELQRAKETTREKRKNKKQQANSLQV